MSDHYAAAESAANAGQWQAAIAYFIGALVDEFRKPDNAHDALLAIHTVATNWATQDTDYDEDTEQQIDDGKAILTILSELGVEL